MAKKNNNTIIIVIILIIIAIFIFSKIGDKDKTDRFRIPIISDIIDNIPQIQDDIQIEPPISGEVLAFPGAQGFGKNSLGGRGGDVYFVTTLNPTGAGSISECVQASGPRTCVFKVSGIIDFGNAGGELKINNPYITIAGQTAPGEGITLKTTHLQVSTHNVIIRGIRSRMGNLPSALIGDSRDSITIGDKTDKEIYDVIIDHCSVSWSIDENIEVISENVHGVTVQNCYIAEALDCANAGHSKVCHSKSFSKHSGGATDVTYYRNVVAHGIDRNPQMMGPGNLEVINNVVYNYGYSGRFGNDIQLHFIGNRYVPGPDSLSNKGLVYDDRASALTKVYVQGNVGPGRLTNTGDEWLISGAPTSFRSTTYLFTPQTTAEDVDSIWLSILDEAGALPHDDVDERIKNEILTGTGKVIDTQDEVGGWSVLNSLPAPLDSDNDGMPDTWELANGLDNNLEDNNLDKDNDGYTNIEEWINSFY